MEPMSTAHLYAGGQEAAADAWSAWSTHWDVPHDHPTGYQGADDLPYMEEASGLPYWDDECESQATRNKIFEDWPAGLGKHYRGQGKTTEYRRPPVDKKSGRLLYWDSFCPEMHNCIRGNTCPFAHTKDEESYHPAKYKTRLCNGLNCRGVDSCCFAHGEEELRRWASEKYSWTASSPVPWTGFAAADVGTASSSFAGRATGSAAAGAAAAALRTKTRFCASYPKTEQCRRGAACAFAHSREEIRTPLLTEAEERQDTDALTDDFFMRRFKIYWCPIGVQHDWQNCVYAHNYQDARREPSIGYGPKPCPEWIKWQQEKKAPSADYNERCSKGLLCPYSHGAKEQLYHKLYFRTVVCRDASKQGKQAAKKTAQVCPQCPRSALCAFFHCQLKERRRVPKDTTKYGTDEQLPVENLNLMVGEVRWADYFSTPPFQGTEDVQALPLDYNPRMEGTGELGGACLQPPGFELPDDAGGEQLVEEVYRQLAWHQACQALQASQAQAQSWQDNYNYNLLFLQLFHHFLSQSAAQAPQGALVRDDASSWRPRKPSNDSDPADETSTIDSVTGLVGGLYGGSYLGRGAGRLQGLGGSAAASGKGLVRAAAPAAVRGGRGVPMKVQPLSEGPFGGPLGAFPGFMASTTGLAGSPTTPSPKFLPGADLEARL